MILRAGRPIHHKGMDFVRLSLIFLFLLAASLSRYAPSGRVVQGFRPSLPKVLVRSDSLHQTAEAPLPPLAGPTRRATV